MGCVVADRSLSFVAVFLAALATAVVTALGNPAPGAAFPPAAAAVAPAEEICPPKDPGEVQAWRDSASKARVKAILAAVRAQLLEEKSFLEPLTKQERKENARTRAWARYYRDLAALHWAASELYDQLADDPPDTNFEVVATPERLPLPRVGREPRALRRALEDFNTSEVRLIAFVDASTTALERSAGAQQAGSATWLRAQQDAAARYARAAATLLERMPAVRNRLRRALASSGVTVDANQRLLASIKRDVRRHGLRELRASLRRYQVPDSTLAELKKAVLGASLRDLRTDPLAGGATDKVDRRAAAALSEFAGNLENAKCTKGYTFNTGTVTVYDNRPTFWTDMTAQASFCSVAPPLGQPWRVWGSSVSYYSDEDGTITIPSTTPADGTITFDGEGKKASLGGSFPWFVLDINLLLNEDPPKARVWLWDGQLSHQREVVVSLVADPNCQPTG